ncbi:MAG: TlpA family protein disulfide reductase [Treponema sp.]|nr:TlpA family protein disulfide reductase [Treponema sp.]
MTQRSKLYIGLAGLAVLIALAIFSYNTLSGRVNPEVSIELPNKNDLMTGSAAERQKAPNFTMLDWEGNSVMLSDIVARGKPVILNFWASWCPPCKFEMPDFNTVHQEFGDEISFVMLSVVDGMRETVATAKKYIDDEGLSLPVYFDTKQEAAIAYGIRFIPSTFVVDTDGYFVTYVQGAVDKTTLRMIVEFFRTES